MRSNRVWTRSLGDCGRDLAQWLKRLTANAKVASVLGSIPASSDKEESEGQQMKQVRYIMNKSTKKSPVSNVCLRLAATRYYLLATGGDSVPVTQVPLWGLGTK